MNPTPLTPLLTVLAAAVLAAPPAHAQAGPPVGSREAMWPAPTAEDWAKPCLITWQRTYEDAIAVSKETGKPILVCVNMDGEIASEHYAGIRYRQPEIAALYEPYVCVIASTYRHNPVDHDEEGGRILCPRFGSVTCGEHIAIEPGLFEQFFEGQRVAPRHIGVEIEGENPEMYDVYYAFDTDTIFNALRDGVAGREAPPPIARGDRPLEERVLSRHNDDMTAVEAAFRTGDRETKLRLVRAAVTGERVTQLGLLRLALFSLDVELSALAREGLARTDEPIAVDLIAQALRVPMAPEEREALVAALERIGESSPRARTFAVAHRGLARGSEALDVSAWSGALASADGAEGPGRVRLALDLEQSAVRRSERAEDPGAALAFAEASVRVAMQPETDPKYRALLFEDGLAAAKEAEALGASGWRVDAVTAVAGYELGDRRQAYERAVAAVSAMPAGDPGAIAGRTLRIFAEARQRAIGWAVRRRADWPGEWIADVHGAFSVLAGHPSGTDADAAMHYDFLEWFGAPQTAGVLANALERFPGSWILHDRLRGRLLREKGAAGLESAYARWFAEHGPAERAGWYQGYTSFVAAEFLRRAGEDAAAVAAYDRAIDHYEGFIVEHPDQRESADHYVSLAIAGRARVALESDDLEGALADILASLERAPESAATQDGLGLSPAGTAQMLLARLKGAAGGEGAPSAERLEAMLDRLEALDPELLLPPASERGGRPSPDARRFGRGG